MKFNKWIFGLISIVAVATAETSRVKAQNVTNIEINASGGTTTTITPQNFYQSTLNFFTSFNPDYTWTNVVFEGATGYKQVTSQGARNVTDFQFNFGKNKRIFVKGSFEFSGIGSAVNAFEFGGGYSIFQHFDSKVDLELMGGYDFNKKSAMIEPAVLLKKKPTTNTHAETGIGFPYYTAEKFNSSPTFFIEAGFTVGNW